MKKIFFGAIFLISLSAFAAEDQVCLFIDEFDTSHPRHPNKARFVDNYRKAIHVYHRLPTCFDLGREYYMQYFLWETDRSIAYGTRCRYTPSKKDDGRILRYDGYSGSTPCPVVDEFSKP